MFRRIVGDHRIEVASPNDVAVLRVDRVCRPLQFERAPVRGCTQSFVAVEFRQLVGEAHVAELLHGPRREAVAACLFARESLLFDDHTVMTVLRKPIARGCPGRAATDDEDFGRNVIRCGHVSRVEPPFSPCRTQRVCHLASFRRPGGRVGYFAVVSRGSRPIVLGAGMSALKSWGIFSKVVAPDSRAAKIGDSGEHQFSYSLAHFSSFGSAPDRS